MKIATYNINNVNKRLANLLHWMKETKPDVVCLQELKCTDRQFPASAFRTAGYDTVWSGEASWNGVAILSRVGEPIVTQTTLPGDASDKQARYIEAAVNGVLVTSLYAPNGNPQPGPKFDYKLAWHKRLEKHAKELFKAGLPVVLAGDYNIVPEPRDIYVTTSYRDNALVQPEPRASFARLLKQGWSDSLRDAFPDEPALYTFWDYRRNRWERDAGLRLDHLLLSTEARQTLTEAGIDRHTRAAEDPSDHAPAWIVLET